MEESSDICTWQILFDKLMMYAICLSHTYFLYQIYWDHRLQENLVDQCYCSVDGTDCPTNETGPISTSCVATKINAAGVRYEDVVSIEKAQIVSINRRWPCGSDSDVFIFRKASRNVLLPDEFVIADNGYSDSKSLQTPVESHFRHSIYNKIRSIHEVLNKRLKQLSYLNIFFNN